MSKVKEIYKILIEYAQEPDPIKRKEIDKRLAIVQREAFKERKNYGKDNM